MKRALVLVFSTLITTTTFALQEPYNIAIELVCPFTKGSACASKYLLKNDGTTISGFGLNSINFQSLPPPLFSTPTQGNIPLDISTGQYTRSGTQYDPNTGVVTCEYTSSAGYDPFAVTYTLTKGTGGIVFYHTPAYIVIRFQLGLKN